MLTVLVALVAWTAPPPEQQAQEVDEAWTILKEGFESKSATRRAKAVHALGLLPNNSRAEEWAESSITDPDVEVRAAAADALGRMGATAACPKLRAALNDKSLKVVLAAANALYILRDPAAYGVFYALLTGERKGPGMVQSQLDMLKDRRELEKLAFETGIGFVPYGGMGYEAWRRMTKDYISPIRVAAAEQLASDPDRRSGEALASSCSDRKWQVRAASVDAIAKRGDPAFLDSVVPRLEDDNDTVRSEAAATVIRLAEAADAQGNRAQR